LWVYSWMAVSHWEAPWFENTKVKRKVRANFLDR
jgi:hypothetical protein